MPTRPRTVSQLPSGSGAASSTEPAAIAEVSIWSGQWVIAQTPTRLNTVLGSCIAVCLFDPHRRVGGMNHYLIPTGGTDGRHGDWSIPELIQGMLAKGSRAAHLEAKIFGGANPLVLANKETAVGPANEAMARTILNSYRIPIFAAHTGANVGMRIIFESWSGTVWVRPHAERTNLHP
jgi:chemotaxis protein CheD